MSVQEEKRKKVEREEPKRPMVRILEEFKERSEEIPPELYEMMERMDEEQIVEELKGLKPETMLYQFTVSGREVRGLSYAGIREAARRMGYIEILPDIRVEEKEKGYYAIVRARDKIRDLTFVGASYQPYKIKKRDGTEEDDPFSYVKAVNKAARNAIRALLPERVISETIEHFLELAKMPKPVHPPTPERPPSPPTPRPEEKPKLLEAPKAEGKITIQFLEDVPNVFDVATGKVLGPFKRNELALLARETAVGLLQSGKAVELRPEKMAPPAEIPEEKPEPQKAVMEREGLWMPFKDRSGKEYGTFKVIQPGVLKVEFDQPIPVDPKLEAGPGGWMRRQLEAMRDKDVGEGKKFEFEFEWIGDFLAGLTIRAEDLTRKRLDHLETVFAWTASRSLEKA